MFKGDAISIYEPSKKLDEKTLKRAKDELNEKDVKQVAADIEYIRKWLSKQDHVRSRMDDEFILSFLRAAKYSYTTAQSRIENFWTHRTILKEWFYDRNFEDDSVLMEIAETSSIVILPNADDDGRRTMILRTQGWLPQKHDINDMSKYSMSCVDILAEDPKVQINGAVLIGDLTCLTAEQATQMSPGIVKKYSKIIENFFPGRFKEMHYYNYPKFFDSLINIWKMFMSEKLKSRLHFHPDLESLHKYVPKKHLPKEYGGDLESVFNMNEKWIEYMKSKKHDLKKMENYGADLEKVAKTKKTEENKSNDQQATGTFRKLNVD